MNLDNVYVGEHVSLPGSKQYSIKIYPYVDKVYQPFLNTEYLKEKIGNPLRDWCDNCFSKEYSLNFRFNNGEPYWSLLCESSEDFSHFMLRYGGLNKR